jgi:hypothetical protein
MVKVRNRLRIAGRDSRRWDLESLSLGTNPDFLALIEQSRVRCQPRAGISTSEMRERLAARRQPAR